MKKKRSLCAALLAGLMVTAVCLTGCGKKPTTTPAEAAATPTRSIRWACAS